MHNLYKAFFCYSSQISIFNLTLKKNSTLQIYLMIEMLIQLLIKRLNQLDLQFCNQEKRGFPLSYVLVPVDDANVNLKWWCTGHRLAYQPLIYNQVNRFISVEVYVYFLLQGHFKPWWRRCDFVNQWGWAIISIWLRQGKCPDL